MANSDVKKLATAYAEFFTVLILGFIEFVIRLLILFAVFFTALIITGALAYVFLFIQEEYPKITYDISQDPAVADSLLILVNSFIYTYDIVLDIIQFFIDFWNFIVPGLYMILNMLVPGIKDLFTSIEGNPKIQCLFSQLLYIGSEVFTTGIIDINRLMYAIKRGLGAVVAAPKTKHNVTGFVQRDPKSITALNSDPSAPIGFCSLNENLQEIDLNNELGQQIPEQTFDLSATDPENANCTDHLCLVDKICAAINNQTFLNSSKFLLFKSIEEQLDETGQCPSNSFLIDDILPAIVFCMDALTIIASYLITLTIVAIADLIPLLIQIIPQVIIAFGNIISTLNNEGVFSALFAILGDDVDIFIDLWNGLCPFIAYALWLICSALAFLAPVVNSLIKYTICVFEGGSAKNEIYLQGVGVVFNTTVGMGPNSTFSNPNQTFFVTQPPPNASNVEVLNLITYLPNGTNILNALINIENQETPCNMSFFLTSVQLAQAAGAKSSSNMGLTLKRPSDQLAMQVLGQSYIKANPSGQYPTMMRTFNNETVTFPALNGTLTGTDAINAYEAYLNYLYRANANSVFDGEDGKNTLSLDARIGRAGLTGNEGTYNLGSIQPYTTKARVGCPLFGQNSTNQNPNPLYDSQSSGNCNPPGPSGGCNTVFGCPNCIGGCPCHNPNQVCPAFPPNVAAPGKYNNGYQTFNCPPNAANQETNKDGCNVVNPCYGFVCPIRGGFSLFQTSDDCGCDGTMAQSDCDACGITHTTVSSHSTIINTPYGITADQLSCMCGTLFAGNTACCFGGTYCFPPDLQDVVLMPVIINLTVSKGAIVNGTLVNVTQTFALNATRAKIDGLSPNTQNCASNEPAGFGANVNCKCIAQQINTGSAANLQNFMGNIAGCLDVNVTSQALFGEDDDDTDACPPITPHASINIGSVTQAYLNSFPPNSTEKAAIMLTYQNFNNANPSFMSLTSADRPPTGMGVSGSNTYASFCADSCTITTNITNTTTNITTLHMQVDNVCLTQCYNFYNVSSSGPSLNGKCTLDRNRTGTKNSKAPGGINNIAQPGPMGNSRCKIVFSLCSCIKRQLGNQSLNGSFTQQADVINVAIVQCEETDFVSLLTNIVRGIIDFAKLTWDLIKSLPAIINTIFEIVELLSVSVFDFLKEFIAQTGVVYTTFHNAQILSGGMKIALDRLKNGTAYKQMQQSQVVSKALNLANISLSFDTSCGAYIQNVIMGTTIAYPNATILNCPEASCFLNSAASFCCTPPPAVKVNNSLGGGTGTGLVDQETIVTGDSLIDNFNSEASDQHKYCTGTGNEGITEGDNVKVRRPRFDAQPLLAFTKNMTKQIRIHYQAMLKDWRKFYNPQTIVDALDSYARVHGLSLEPRRLSSAGFTPDYQDINNLDPLPFVGHDYAYEYDRPFTFQFAQAMLPALHAFNVSMRNLNEKVFLHRVRRDTPPTNSSPVLCTTPADTDLPQCRCITINGTCRANVSSPYCCCHSGASPEVCCGGLPGCIPFSVLGFRIETVKTFKWLMNINADTCASFDTGPKELLFFIRVFTSSLVYRFIQASPTQQIRDFYQVFLGWLTFPNNQFPPYGLFCAFFNLGGFFYMIFLLLLIGILFIAIQPYLKTLLEICGGIRKQKEIDKEENENAQQQAGMQASMMGGGPGVTINS